MEEEVTNIKLKRLQNIGRRISAEASLFITEGKVWNVLGILAMATTAAVAVDLALTHGFNLVGTASASGPVTTDPGSAGIGTGTCHIGPNVQPVDLSATDVLMTIKDPSSSCNYSTWTKWDMPIGGPITIRGDEINAHSQLVGRYVFVNDPKASSWYPATVLGETCSPIDFSVSSHRIFFTVACPSSGNLQVVTPSLTDGTILNPIRSFEGVNPIENFSIFQNIVSGLRHSK